MPIIAGQITGSALTASVDYAVLANKPSGIVSGAAQLTSILPSGTVSSSGQVDYTALSNLPIGVVTSSAQINADEVSGLRLKPAVITSSLQVLGVVTSGSVTAILPTNTVTSSVQVKAFLPGGTVSSSTQIPALLPTDVVSSSAQITLNGIQGTTFATANFVFPQDVSVNGTLKTTTTPALAGIPSSSAQVKPLLPDGTVTASAASSPSQGTVRVSINGVNTDVDTGLQTADTPTFTGLNVIGTPAMDGIPSSSTQIKPLLPLGTISASAIGTTQGTISLNGVEVTVAGLTAASNPQFVTVTANLTGTASLATNALTPNLVSSSAQVQAFLPSNTVSSSAQVKVFLPTDTVSSSISGDAQGQVKVNGVNINVTSLQTNSSPTFNTVTANLTGTSSWATNAVSANSATNVINVGVTNDATTDASRYLAFVDATSGNNPVKVDSALIYNPLSNTLSNNGGVLDFASVSASAGLYGTASWAQNVAGTIANATNATNATNVAIGTAADSATYYVTFTDNTSGNRPTFTDANSLSYNPGTNTLTVTTVLGNLTGTASLATNALTAGLVSSSTQVKANLPGGTVSSSAVGTTQGTIALNGVDVPAAGLTAVSSPQFAGLSVVGTPAMAGIPSSSAQVKVLLPDGTISSSTQVNAILDADGVLSSSSQVQLNLVTGTTFANSNFTFPQNLIVGGQLTAERFVTEYISSSIIYESGSTKFGDSVDDVMSVTGSIRVSLGGVTSSLFGTASWATNAVSANTATTSTTATNATSASVAAQATVTQLPDAAFQYPVIFGNGFENGAHTLYTDSQSLFYQPSINRLFTTASLALAVDGLTYTKATDTVTVANITSTGTVALAGVVSSSTASSPSQGTVRVTVNGVNTDVDTGLQTADSPTFAGLTVVGTPALGGIYSSSAQVDYNSIQNKLSGVYSSSAFTAPSQGTARLTLNGVALSDVDLGLQTGDSPTFSALTVTNAVNAAAITASGLTANQAIFTNASDGFVSNAITGTGNVVMSASPTLTGTVTAANITANGTLLLQGIYSSSAQVDHNATTNYSANRHIDHTAVSISTGTGLTGGGDISTSRTLALTGQALAFHNLASNGVVVRTAADTVTARSIAVSGTGLTVSNADGVAGNPTITIGGGVVSGSSLSSPSQGTVRLTTNGVNTDVDTGLQTGDSPTFAGMISTAIISGSGTSYRLVIPVGANYYAT